MNTLNEATITAADTLVEHHLSSTSKTPGAYTTLYKDGAFILIASGDLARELQVIQMVQELVEEIKEVSE